MVFQKVTQCLKQYTELPRRTPEDLECALKVLDEALQISSYSEQLLQMKADTLLMVCITVNKIVQFHLTHENVFVPANI